MLSLPICLRANDEHILSGVEANMCHRCSHGRRLRLFAHLDNAVVFIATTSLLEDAGTIAAAHVVALDTLTTASSIGIFSDLDCTLGLKIAFS